MTFSTVTGMYTNCTKIVAVKGIIPNPDSLWQYTYLCNQFSFIFGNLCYFFGIVFRSWLI